MSSKRISLIKGPSVGKALASTSKKGVVSNKARFSFDAQTNGKAKAGNGHSNHGASPGGDGGNFPRGSDRPAGRNGDG